MADPVPTKAPVAPPKMVWARNELGELGQIPETDVASLQESGGRVVSPEELAEERLQAQYGDTRGQAIAAGAGFARGITLGGSDVAARALGGKEVVEELEGVRRANPNISLASEIGGAVAPAFIPGGMVGNVLRATPAGLAGAAGRGAERLVARSVGQGATGLLPRMMQRGAALAAQGAVETALLEVGSQISDDVLGDKEVTAEKLMAALGRGFYSGGKLGAAFGAGSALIERAGTAIISKTAGALDAEKNANRYAVKSTGAKIGDYKRWGKTADQIEDFEQKTGKLLRDEQIVDASVKSHEEMAERLSAAKQKYGQELGDLRSKLNGTGVKVDTYDVDARVWNEVIAPLRNSPTAEKFAVADEVEKYLDRFTKQNGRHISFDKAHELRRDLDDILYANRKDPSRSLYGGEMQKVRNIMEDVFETEAEKALQHVDPSFLEKYKATKDVYGRLAKVEDVLTKEVARDAAAAPIRARDYLAGGTATYALSRVGAMVAGSPGAAVGSMIGGVVGGAVNRLVNERGPQLMADVLGRAAKLKALQSATSGYTGQIEKGIQAFLNNTAAVGQTVEQKRHKYAEYDKIAQHIRTMASSPQLVAERVGGLVHRDTQRVAPEVLQAMVVNGLRTYNALAARLPGVGSGLNYLQPTLANKGRRPSDAEIAKFFRYLDAVDDSPRKVLEMARKGRLHREALEIMKEASPHLFDFVRQDMMRQLGKHTKPLTTQQRAALNLIYDIPTDATHEKDWIDMAQAAHDPAFLEDSGGPNEAPVASANGAAPKRPVSGLEQDTQTVTDQLMA